MVAIPGVSFQSRLLAVGQPAKVATCGNETVALLPSGRFPVGLASFAICDPLAFPTVGLGQPVSGGKVDALSDVRAPEARSAQICRCEGVARCFHVSRYKVEPIERARNLLSKDDWRAALRDEPVPDRPEVSLVVEALLLPRSAEGLAGARAGPDRATIGPSGDTKGSAPDADPGEEVALSKSSKFICADIEDAPFVDHAGRDMACGDEVAQPLGRIGVGFVVPGGHRSLAPSTFAR